MDVSAQEASACFISYYQCEHWHMYSTFFQFLAGLRNEHGPADTIHVSVSGAAVGDSSSC
jgi:hypothetical protein